MSLSRVNNHRHIDLLNGISSEFMDFSALLEKDSHFAYDIAINNDAPEKVITLKTLHHEYVNDVAGRFGCNIPNLAGREIQRVYEIMYRENIGFSNPILTESVKFSAFCSSSDRGSFDWVEEERM
jgi:hypothetical protein